MTFRIRLLVAASLALFVSMGAFPVLAPVSVQSYGASGSSSSSVATISASSNALSLASAVDFVNGQGIRVNHAGVAFSLGSPTGLSVSPTCATSCTTTYQYQISALDGAGGVGAAISPVSTAAGGAALSTTVYNTISWAAPGGATPAGYAVYRSISGTYTLIGVVAQTSFVDVGLAAYPYPFLDWVPSTASSAALADWLVTTISSGGGTTSLTLAASATTSVTNSVAYHDDTAAIQAALTAYRDVYVPSGTYNTTGTIAIPSGTYLHGAAFSSVLTLIPVNKSMLTLSGGDLVSGIKFLVSAGSIALNLNSVTYGTIRDIQCQGAQVSPSEKAYCVYATGSGYVTIDSPFLTSWSEYTVAGAPPAIYLEGEGNNPSNGTGFALSHITAINDGGAALFGALITFNNVYTSSIYQSLFNGFSPSAGGNATAIEVQGPGQVIKIAGNHFMNWGWPIKMESTGAGAPINLDVVSNVFDWCMHQCALLNQGSNVNIVNNSFVGEGVFGTVGVYFGSAFTLGPNVVDGNDFNGFSATFSNPIVINSPNNTTIANNRAASSNAIISGSCGPTACSLVNNAP